MASKKLSPAQQILVAAITGKTLTYRLVSMWRGGVSTSSLVDVRIGGEKTEIKVRLSTIESLADKGEVILTCVNQGSREYTVVLPAPEVEAHEVEATEAPEVEAPEVEAHEAHEVEATEVEATEAPEAPESDKIKYAIDNVKKQIDKNEGNLDQDSNDDERHYYLKKDCRLKGELIKLEAELKTSTSEATHEAKAARAESLAKTEVRTRYLIDTAVKAVNTLSAVEAALRQAEITAGHSVAQADAAERDADWRLDAQERAQAWEVKTHAWVERDKECKHANKAHARAKVETAAAAEVAAERIAVAEACRAKVVETAEVAEACRAKVVETAEAAAGLNKHLHNLGTLLLMQGKTEAAEKVYYELYELQKKAGNLQEAKQPLWEIIINCPDESSTAYTLLGKLCEELEQYPDAIAAYTQAIGDTGINEDYLYGLHRAYLAMGDEAQAQKYLEQARKLVDEREIAMGRCIPVPAHRDAALSQETADAIARRHNVIVDRASEMYTNDDPSHTNDYGAKGWKLIPQKWIDEFTTQS